MRRAVVFYCEARIRERRGALLFGLNEESTAKVNHRRFLHLSFFVVYLKVSYLSGDMAEIRWPA